MIIVITLLIHFVVLVRPFEFLEDGLSVLLFEVIPELLLFVAILPDEIAGILYKDTKKNLRIESSPEKTSWTPPSRRTHIQVAIGQGSGNHVPVISQHPTSITLKNVFFPIRLNQESSKEEDSKSNTQVPLNG